MARTRSVDLSMTITAAVPSPDLRFAQRVEVHEQVFALFGGIIGTRSPPGDNGFQVAQPPRTPPH